MTDETTPTVHLALNRDGSHGWYADTMTSCGGVAERAHVTRETSTVTCVVCCNVLAKEVEQALTAPPSLEWPRRRR